MISIVLENYTCVLKLIESKKKLQVSDQLHPLALHLIGRKKHKGPHE